jgi:drug/metabolite transporter (DMT)-like permease
MGIWAMFWLVAVIWGSSFMLIRIGVAWVNPIHLVTLRVGIAAIGLAFVIMATRRRIPRDPKTLLSLMFIGFGNNVLPFILISWGEISVESGLASVLQSTAALFTLVVAHFTFTDERINVKKALGLTCGFIGVVVLSARNWQGGELMTSSLAGQFAIVGASLSYAVFGAFSRKVINSQTDPKKKVEPVMVAFVSMMTAALINALLSFLGAQFFNMPTALPAETPIDVILAVLTLGFVNTFIAYLMFYEIVKHGAARASMVTYVVPVVGLILGVLFLNEPMDIYIIIGAALIFTGIAIVNLRLGQWLRMKPKTAEHAPAGD